MIARHLIVPLTVALIAIQVAEVKSQGAFPAPLPGASVSANDPAFPPVNGPVTAAVIGAPSAVFSAGAAPLAGSAFERRPAEHVRDFVASYAPVSRDWTEGEGKRG